MPPTVLTPEPELDRLLRGLDPRAAQAARTVAHAWAAGGGTLSVGRLAARLVGRDPAGRPFSAATLHGDPARLELVRVLLRAHGLGEAQWTAWCDERPELRAHGLDLQARFPTVRLGGLGSTDLARLAEGVRDLALACSRSVGPGSAGGSGSSGGGSPGATTTATPSAGGPQSLA